jgi:glycine cleavage system aminomethyltransferase T
MELRDEVEKSFPLAIHAPYDTEVDYYVNSRVAGLGNGYMAPMQYTTWRDEVMSWKESCYIHTGLNDAPTFRVKGSDALKFFSSISVNSFAKFPVGGIKHCIMCSENGNVIAHGVLLRLGEDEFESFFLAPYAAYKFFTGNYNATGEFISDQFIFQIAGPRSLELLEETTTECLHDIKFARHRKSRINGMDVRIARVGMAGTLAYEVHGLKKQARPIYNSIFETGKAYGIKKLGFYAYQLSHTEDGFPQCFMHFPPAWNEDKGLLEFLKMPRFSTQLHGSMGNDMSLLYRNPIELGWAKTVVFDHDFIGRDALEKEMTNPRRTMVTLVWNP